MARRTRRPDPNDVPLIDEPDPGDDGLGEFEEEASHSLIKADYKREPQTDCSGQRLSKAKRRRGKKRQSS